LLREKKNKAAVDKWFFFPDLLESIKSAPASFLIFD
jgi:hypothetical protein